VVVDVEVVELEVDVLVLVEVELVEDELVDSVLVEVVEEELDELDVLDEVLVEVELDVDVEVKAESIKSPAVVAIGNEPEVKLDIATLVAERVSVANVRSASSWTYPLAPANGTLPEVSLVPLSWIKA